MGQYGFDLIRRELIYQGIAQHDPAGIAKPGQGGVGSFGPFGHVELEYAAHLRMGAFSQLHQAFGQFGVLLAQRDKFVEERHDQDGRQVGQDDGKDQHACAGPQPPPPAGQPQGQVNQFQDYQAQRGGDQKILQLVHHPAFEILGGLAETVRQYEAGVIAQRQFEQGGDAAKDYGESQHEQPFIGRERPQPGGQCVCPAEHQPGQQINCRGERIHQPQAPVYAGVLFGLFLFFRVKGCGCHGLILPQNGFLGESLARLYPILNFQGV